MKATSIGLIVIVIIVIVAKLFFYFFETTIDYRNFEITTGIIALVALIGIIRSGTILKSNYFKGIQFSLGGYCIGGLLKIMHWHGGNLLLTLSMTGIIVAYIIRFTDKKTKTILDVFKMLLVVSAMTEGILRLLHLVKSEYLIFGNLMVWFVILFYIIEQYKELSIEEDTPKNA